MTNNIIVETKELQVREKYEDVFSDFSLPSLVRPLIKEKTNDIIKILFDTAHLSSLYKSLNQNEFILRFSKKIEKGLKAGKYQLNMRKDGRGFTPTASTKEGFVGQGFVEKRINSNAVSNALTNYAMYAMLNQISSQLQEVKQEVEIIREGQNTDRLGSIIGAFRAYVIAYPTFLNEQERRNASFEVYKTISQGLHQIHFELDTLAKNLEVCPTSLKEIGLQWLDLFQNVLDKKEKMYSCLVYGLYKYYNMLKLSDIILLDRGADENVILENHQGIESFCNRVLNEDLDKKAKFLTGGDIKDYLDIKNNIYEYNAKIQNDLIPTYRDTFNLEIKVDSNTIQKLINNER